MKALLHLFQHRCRRVTVRSPTIAQSRCLLRRTEYHAARSRVAVEVTVARVSQSHWEKTPQEGVFTTTERVAMAANLVPLCCSTEPLGETGRLSLEPVLLVVANTTLVSITCCTRDLRLEVCFRAETDKT